MSVQEHFHVFETLLFGLAIAHLMIGVGKMIDHQETIKTYWMHSLTVISLFLIVVQAYFINYQHPLYEMLEFNYQFLLMSVFPIGAVFMCSYQLFPEKISGTDFEDFFWKKARIVIFFMVVLGLGYGFRNQWSFTKHHGGDVPFYVLMTAMIPQFSFGLLGVLAIIYNSRKIIYFIIIGGTIFQVYESLTSKLGW
jgi:hypothetical protein